MPTRLTRHSRRRSASSRTRRRAATAARSWCAMARATSASIAGARAGARRPKSKDREKGRPLGRPSIFRIPEYPPHSWLVSGDQVVAFSEGEGAGGSGQRDERWSACNLVLAPCFQEAEPENEIVCAETAAFVKRSGRNSRVVAVHRNHEATVALK